MIATDIHVLGGHHEIERLAWDEEKLLIEGRYRRAPGLEGKAYVYVPPGYRPKADAQAPGALKMQGLAAENLWVQEVRFREAAVDWVIPFERARPR